MTPDDLPPRLAARLRVSDNGCWLFTGALKGRYGRVSYGGRLHYLHRLTYTLLVGPVDDGDVLHHRHECPKHCAYPQHLTPVTRREHSTHHDLVGRAAANLTRTHCPVGHLYPPAARGGARRCEECGRRRSREHQRRRRAALPRRPRRTQVQDPVTGRFVAGAGRQEPS